MSCAVTAREIDELEELLLFRHNRHINSLGPLASCSDKVCMEARSSIAWLRSQLELQSSPPVCVETRVAMQR
jgi:hypothetical protein